MELKNTIFKYFLTCIISFGILSGCMYLYQIYISEKKDSATGRDATRGPAKTRGPPSPVRNPDGCYITLEDGTCAEPGSF